MSQNENMDVLVGEGVGQVEYPTTSKNGSHTKNKHKDNEDIEKKLRESEERFRLMFEQASVGMAFASLNGRLIQVNQRYCDITGYTREALLGRTVSSITHPDDVAKTGRSFSIFTPKQYATTPC